MYLVGGAVRDALLELPVEERDWVVVGATPAQMQELGFTPIDADFPVFRHPDTGEEYALARREIKRGEGYRGFAIDAGPDVTLEEDLQRRDLTINAIAQAEDGSLVDPFGGRDDLDAGLLRHVSPAFTEDPVRLLRAGRFAAKLGQWGFRLAHGTHRLMCAMVERGDVAYLKPERFWRETSKAMQTQQPWRYFEVLHRCGALQELMPPLANAMGELPSHGDTADSLPIAALKRVAVEHDEVAIRLASLIQPCLESESEVDAWMQRLRADRATAELLRRVVAARELAVQARSRSPQALSTLIMRWRGLTSPDGALAASAVIDAQYGGSDLQKAMRLALQAAADVSAQELSAQGLAGRELGERLEQERARAIAAALERAWTAAKGR
jgi:tRNA nucleotidyltransferase (CCA-adding enzyme)